MPSLPKWIRPLYYEEIRSQSPVPPSHELLAVNTLGIAVGTILVYLSDNRLAREPCAVALMLSSWLVSGFLTVILLRTGPVLCNLLSFVCFLGGDLVRLCPTWTGNTWFSESCKAM